MCWLAGLCMSVFRSLFKTVLISEAGPKLQFGKHDVSFWDAGERFWQLGSTLGTQGAKGTHLGPDLDLSCSEWILGPDFGSCCSTLE